jgi:predicted nucleic acid-binding protein
MARYVIDVPALLRIVDGDEQLDPAHQLVAPSSLRSEALQILLDEVRQERRTEQSARQAHERITELKMRLLGDRRSRGTAWRIAREQGWATLGPAEYVAVTRLQADGLVAMDPDLATKAADLVPVVPFEALLREK